jgi:hypothetical protein
MPLNQLSLSKIEDGSLLLHLWAVFYIDCTHAKSGGLDIGISNLESYSLVEAFPCHECRPTHPSKNWMVYLANDTTSSGHFSGLSSNCFVKGNDSEGPLQSIFVGLEFIKNANPSAWNIDSKRLLFLLVDLALTAGLSTASVSV